MKSVSSKKDVVRNGSCRGMPTQDFFTVLQMEEGENVICKHWKLNRGEFQNKRN
jgi:hypothetical protein